MAWNGSSQDKGNAASAKRRDAGAASNRNRRAAWLRGLVAGGVVVAAGAIALFVLRGGNAARGPKPEPAKKPIAEVAPAKPAAAAPKPAPKPVDPNARPTKVGEMVNGYVKLPSGRIHKVTGVITNSIANRPKAKYEIFDRRCNNEIAAYLTIKPGDTIVGTPNYNGRFKKDFLESLKEPIIISDEDSPEHAQLKRDVIAARLELKDAMDRGEDIEKIMLDTRAELQNLMVAKMQLKHMFFEERKKCETEQEVQDLFNACNKVLEGKGIAPITYGPITKRNLMRGQQAE